MIKLCYLTSLVCSQTPPSRNAHTPRWTPALCQAPWQSALGGCQDRPGCRSP